MVRVAMLLLAGVAGAQPPAGGGPQEKVVRLEDLPPGIRLGARVEGVRRNWKVIPTVVIVPDAASYVEAVGRWTHAGRYPVLIDDGSERCREDIARFVRGFAPAAVVRWSAAPHPWPAGAAERRTLIEGAVYRIWASPLPGEAQGANVTSERELVDRLKRLEVPVPGIVAADPMDDAWPAALALAAGRCEPLAWVSIGQGVNGTMPREAFEALETALEHACQETGLAWRGLGDELDAVTLALNCPVKVQMDEKTVAATTDLLCRKVAPGEGGAPGTSRDKGERWAWAGQVFGSPSQAAYRAMCGLFLMSRQAWVFDGYPETKPWNEFDGTKAGKALGDAGFDVTLDDSPRNGERAWRSRCEFGVNAGFIAVNSKGMADEFNLEPGQCRPGEVPFLKVPAAVYMVHSWSAAAPTERGTVGGRWLERGVYAYLGSTYEPYLQAFIPTPILATRLAMSYPWGAAVRPDNTVQAWKLATIGDPLITFGPPAPRAEESLALPGSESVEERMRAAVAGRRFEEAIAALTVLGRDADAAKLAAALRRDEPREFTAAVAAAALLPALRARDADLAVACYQQFPPDMAADASRRDALWHACELGLSGEAPEAMLAVLRENLRADQVGEDAARLSRPLASRFGRDTALAMLEEARPKATTDYDRRAIDDAARVLRSLPARR